MHRDCQVTDSTYSDTDRCAVRLRDISVAFGGYRAVSAVDLEIGEGEFVALVGPTGCGKSTLLNVVAGLTQPTTGQVHTAGDTPAGYLFQRDALLPWKTAIDNIAMGLVFRGHTIKEAR